MVGRGTGVGTGGDLEANYVQGDVVIFQFWRNFFKIIFLVHSLYIA
jgi:hypothetical protein